MQNRTIWNTTDNLITIIVCNHMQILIYGFKPYGPYQTNISEQVIDALPYNRDVERHVFAVKFDYQMFNKCFKKVIPDIILGLGQHPRARKLRIERKARNRMKLRDGTVQAIKTNAPQARYSNLKLPDSPNSTLTYNAGNYVCNFSMFLMGEYSERTNCRFGFIHVPAGMDYKLVKRYISHSCDVLRNNIE